MNMSTARIDRSKRCSQSQFEVTISMHMSKTVLQIEDRDPVVARALREVEKFKVCVLFQGLYLQLNCSPSLMDSSLGRQVFLQGSGN